MKTIQIPTEALVKLQKTARCYNACTGGKIRESDMRTIDGLRELQDEGLIDVCDYITPRGVDVAKALADSPTVTNAAVTFVRI